MHTPMKDEGVEEEISLQQEYNQWLLTNNVFIASDLVEMTTQGVVAGWGCVAKSDINEGTVLFSIPKDACFRAPVIDNDDFDGNDEDSNADNDEDDDDDPTTIDSQKDLAIHFLRCKQQSPTNNDFVPFLRMLTPSSLPWTWPENFRKSVLRGTELEKVVESKVKRISVEYETIVKTNKDKEKAEQINGLTYANYVDASAVVASHVNPWFGGSIVPFNTTLNWGSVANVEFCLQQGNNAIATEIVGKAICDIAKGCELFQEYGESVAEIVYKYGFAPTNCRLEGDVASLALSDILSVAQEMLATKQQDYHSLKSGTHTPNHQERQLIAHLSLRIQALKQSGAIDVSPWDGMDDYLTAEVTYPSNSFLSFLSQSCRQYKEQSDYDDGGLSKIICIFLVLLADDDDWKRASAALDHLHISAIEKDGICESDDDNDVASSRSDDISASILLSALANLSDKQCNEMKELALSVGSNGNDPWRALLLNIACLLNSTNSDCERISKRKKIGTEEQNVSQSCIDWKGIIEATKAAVRNRLRMSLEGEINIKIDAHDDDNTHRGNQFSAEEKIKAIDAVSILRGIERGILEQALEILDLTSHELNVLV